MSNELLNTPLTFKKATAGTYVFAAEEAGISGIYLPKSYFQAAKVDPTKVQLHLVVGIVSPDGK